MTEIRAGAKKCIKENLPTQEPASMAAALLSPGRTKGKHRWVRRPTSGRTIYAYVYGNPISYVDRLGLEGAGVGWTPEQMRQLGAQHGQYQNEYAAGVRAFVRNYRDMREANTIGADKYFHCKANCEATQQGHGGKEAACNVSNGREKFDQGVKGDSAFASAADQAANIFGRNHAGEGTCSQVCSGFRPNGLAPGY